MLNIKIVNQFVTIDFGLSTNALTLIAMFEFEFVVGKWTLHNIFTWISLVFCFS
jgi:hypothetical protein